jgi:hypothetical protein
VGADSLDVLRVAAQVERELAWTGGAEGMIEVSLRSFADQVRRAGAARPRSSPRPALRRGATADLGASACQRRYLARCGDGDRPEFHVSSVVELDTALEPPRVRAALRELVARHEVLRARFGGSAAAPAMTIEGDVPAPLEVLDLGGGADRRDAGRQHVIRAALEACNALFDLGAAPLFRARLLRFGAADHVLVFVFHHLITDGWSRQIFERELAALLDAAGRGPGALAPAPRYATFVAWEAARRPEEVLHFVEAHRLRALIERRLELPAGSPEGGSIILRLGGEQRRALEVACRRLAATPFVVLLTALVSCLRTWSPDGHVVVTTDHANRDRADLEQLVGLLADVLPIAVATDGETDPVELLPRVRRATHEALSRRVLPFADLVDAIAPGMLARYDVLFPVGFFLEAAAPERAFRPARPRSRVVGNEGLSRPLMVTAELASDSLSVCFERRGGWLSAPLLDELARGFGSALRALLERST